MGLRYAEGGAQPSQPDGRDCVSFLARAGDGEQIAGPSPCL